MNERNLLVPISSKSTPVQSHLFESWFNAKLIPARTASAAGISAAILLIGFLSVLRCPAQVNVVTQHNDMGRTGQNTNESTLTPSNVNSSSFGKLFSLPVDGQVYAQPLYLSGLQFPGSGVHNTVFIATEHDSVYAFDADSNGGANTSPLWQASLLTQAYGAAPGATTVSSQIVGEDIVPEYGITGTPVIDPVAGLLYVVSFTQEGTSFVLRLHALSVTTGAEMLGGPVVVGAQVAGTGTGSSGGTLQFVPKWQNQRSGLLLLNGILYIGFSSHEDNGPWHGWILSYNPSTLAQIGTMCTSPNGVGSGVWMGGDGLAADLVDPVGHPFGRMFVSTGNGDYNAASPYTSSMDYGDSILNIDLTNGIPVVKDEFTPSNQAALDSGDVDLGSGGVLILPDQAGTYPHLLVQEGKGGTIYLVNRDQMGGYSSTDSIVQEVTSASNASGTWGGPAYWNGNLYIGEKGNHAKAYSLTNGVLSTAPTSVSTERYVYPGPSPSVSSLGNTNGIVWAIEADAYTSGGNSVLRAYDATNIAHELYNSSQVSARDSAGVAIKLAVPTIANGKVYVGTAGEVDVYGLLSSEPLIAPPVINPGSTSFTNSIQVTITDAVQGATIYYTTDGSSPSTASTIYTGPITVNSTQTITAIAVAPGYVWITPVSATFTSLNSTGNPLFSPQGGNFSTATSVSLTDATPGAAIYYTTDGSIPSNASTLYSAPIAVSSSTTIRAIAIASGLSNSAIVTQNYTTQSGVNFSQGFANAQGVMSFNGSTTLDDSRLQLTNGYTSSTGSAFVTAPLNVQAFVTDFQFQLSNPGADGITFTIQGSSPSAKGTYSAGLGYSTIAKSVAIKFDFFNDAGEGADSTGLYINGVAPTIPALNLTSSGINLLSGDAMSVHLTYDGINLAMTVSDLVTAATWSTVWQVNIPQVVGGNTAYVGFTGSTQILTASQKIGTWTYSAVAPGLPSATATPQITPGSGTYSGPQVVSITDSTASASIYYTTDGTPPTTSSSLYSAPFTVSGSQKIQAMALLPGGAPSAATSATIAITPTVSNAVPNYAASKGIGYGSIILNGATFVAKTPQTRNVTSLQLTDGSFNESRSAYFATPVNIQAFITDFDFQLANAAGQGFTFTIQNAGLNAVGAQLGYLSSTTGTGSAISNSIAIAFDINGTLGQGANSTLLCADGTLSSLPASSLNGSGIQLKSGDVIHAHIAYDGINLTLTLSDATTSATVTEVYPVNIPGTVGGNTAYVGFTAGTGGTSATQNILDWTYSVATPATVVTAVPVLSPGSGTYTSATTVTITDTTAGAVIYYTTDGSMPTAASTVYTGPITVNTSGTIQAVAQAPADALSGMAGATFNISTSAVSYSTGFASAQGLTLNGGASINGTLLQLTDGGPQEARSVYLTNPVNVQTFTTDFDFQLLNAISDGFTFTIQNQGVTAVGNTGSGLGYGLSSTGTGKKIVKSVAVKFDIHSNSGEGSDSTGIYINGASPTIPATNLSTSGVQLNSGDVIHAHIAYDGTNLTLTLTDATTSATVTEVYPVNIPATVGGNTAYVGFTAGTGGTSATQNILDWTYSVATPATVVTAIPVLSPGSGTYTSATTVTITDTTAGAVIYYTTDGSMPTAASTVYSSPITISATATIQAVAQAPGDVLSGVAAATYTMNVPTASYSTGFASAQGLTLNGGASINGTVLQLTDGGPQEARSVYLTNPVNVQTFTTDFDFQLLNAISDGFTFTIQNQGVTAVGNTGSGLGYGLSSTGTGKKIVKSVAVKFDIHSNSGEGSDSTGIYTNGASPTIPATNLSTSGVQLNSGDVIHAHIAYDGTNLTLTLTDASTTATVTEVYPVNIPATVGGNTAYVGFTAGTGGTSATQNILDWTYSTP